MRQVHAGAFFTIGNSTRSIEEFVGFCNRLEFASSLRFVPFRAHGERRESAPAAFG